MGSATDLGETAIRGRAAGEGFAAIAVRLGVKAWRVRRDHDRALASRAAHAEADTARAAGRPDDAPLLSAGLPKRACNALMAADYATVGQVAAATDRRLRLCHNLGPDMLAAIRAVIPRREES